MGLKWIAPGLFGLALAVSCAAGNDETAEKDCPVGSETCPCTTGGSCDPGLDCFSGICVDPNASGGGGASSSGGGIGGLGSSGTGGQQNCEEGCQKIDVLFALDHSASMNEEIAALSGGQSFTEIINTLAAVNCGDIDFRIGLTDDNDVGFIVPSGWSGAVPWFDSTVMAIDAIAAAFNGAGASLMGGPVTPTGCEHVLTSATHLLKADTTGFIRDDALLVLILVTDVDDYGEYDQNTWLTGACAGLGCGTLPVPPLSELNGDLLALKNGDGGGLAAIVVAGDPNVTAGLNMCNQPGSCAGGSGYLAFHATRLWAFAELQSGTNGTKADICDGAANVPTAIKTAFDDNIDLACKGFEPPR
ncbi:MAG: hypothetical protein DRI90_07985 [Deltaproteobacteria bacterium]|nr:MAG: hypothetical protein DRI90_07985 [Deltaproteobacteria bacterium]